MNWSSHIYQDIKLFGVDYIYGRHGSRFPTGELKLLIVATTSPLEANPKSMQQ